MVDPQQQPHNAGLEPASPRFWSAFVDAPIGMALVGVRREEAGKYLAVNREFCRQLDQTEEALLRLTIYDITHPDDVPATREAARAFSRGEVDRYEIVKRHVGRSGNAHWVNATATRVFDADGTPYAVSHIIDIDSEVKARALLDESERRSRALVEHSSDIITVLEADGAWRSSSPAGTRLLGWPPGFDPSGGILDIVHPDDVPVAAEAFREVIEGRRGPGEPVEFRVRTFAGEWRTFETVAQNLVDDPSVRGIVLNSRDVTDRVQAQEALRRSERDYALLEAHAEQRRLELELAQARRLESLGRLAGGIAHDFNNLLGVILNYAHLLEEQLPSGTGTHDVDRIRAAAERGVTIVRQLLLYGGRGSNTTELIDVNSLVASLVDMVRRALGDVTVTVERGTTACLVEMNRSELEQVVLNLLINARDASPKGATVTIGSSASEPDDGTPPLVTLTVADRGAGMSDDTRARAFEPFFTTKPVGEGSGLGLASVLGVAERVGGRVEIESQLGVGTTVRVILPAARAERSHGVDATPPAPNLAASESGRVLVVDDDEAVLSMTAQLLERGGFEVIAAESAARALELLKDGIRPQLVITDVAMPGMQGTDLALAIDREYDIPVLLMSGFSQQLAPEIAMRFSVLAKPFTPQALQSATTRSIHRRP